MSVFKSRSPSCFNNQPRRFCSMDLTRAAPVLFEGSISGVDLGNTLRIQPLVGQTQLQILSVVPQQKITPSLPAFAQQHRGQRRLTGIVSADHRPDIPFRKTQPPQGPMEQTPQQSVAYFPPSANPNRLVPTAMALEDRASLLVAPRQTHQ